MQAEPSLAPITDTPGLPRVLLIGDSITRGYYPAVEKQLAGKACVARLTTSASPDMNCSGNFSTDKRGGTLAIIVTFPLENKQA